MPSVATTAPAHHQPDAKEIRLVIAASSAGTVFEWYDFSIYGPLGRFIAAAFFRTGNPTLSLLLTWVGFAIGFVLGLLVVLACRFLIPAEAFAEWGWRMPFLLSIVLLVLSLWMRLKLNESPVFGAMKAEGEVSRNPFVESFTYRGNKKRIFIALFGVACGLTIVFYAALFYTLSFLKGPMRTEITTAEVLVGIGSLLSVVTLVGFGSLSNRLGRKEPVVWGYVAALLLLFPLFWALSGLVNPPLAGTALQNPIMLEGPGCDYDPFAPAQRSECGRLIGELSDRGIPYHVQNGPQRATLFGDQRYELGDMPGSEANRALINRDLAGFGYTGPDQVPPVINMVYIVLVVFAVGALTGVTYGPVAALLHKVFPPKIRYRSMPILRVVSLAVAWWGLPGGLPRDFSDDPAR